MQAAETVAMDDAIRGSTLISASCTTSWFDWIRGELWLCPNGLLARAGCSMQQLC
jgi:hypothetical protein